MGGQAVAAGKEDAPGQLKKAEQEAEEIESEVEESEELGTIESEDTESDEVSEETTEALVDEGSDDDDEGEQQFRISSADSGTTSSRESSDGSGGSTTRASSSDDDEDDPNFVESAEDCPNEKNRFGEFTGNGANDSGAYDSTCDGRASENGNGNGEASGRPCMGCVGNADNKNPPGQFPDGSDANNGYECDGNNGVGKGNPAHTDCVEEDDEEEKPRVLKTCPDGRPMPSNGICDEPVKRPPLPDVIQRPSVPQDRVLPRVPFARPPEVPKFVPRRRVSGVLPVTGPSQLLPFIWVAMSLIAAGIAALVTSRRRRELGARDW